MDYSTVASASDPGPWAKNHPNPFVSASRRTHDDGRRAQRSSDRRCRESLEERIACTAAMSMELTSLKSTITSASSMSDARRIAAETACTVDRSCAPCIHTVVNPARTSSADAPKRSETLTQVAATCPSMSSNPSCRRSVIESPFARKPLVRLVPRSGPSKRVRSRPSRMWTTPWVMDRSPADHTRRGAAGATEGEGDA